MVSNIGSANQVVAQNNCANSCGSQNANSNSVISPYADYANSLTDTAQDSESSLADILDKYGADMLELSPDADYSMTYAKSQFQVNYQVLKSINTANGVETQEINFSLNASFEYLNMSSGGEPVDSTSGSDAMSKMMDFFSPEKTAGRILDFALSFYPQSDAYSEGGDSEESRQAFADYIGAAVQKGFDEAQGILSGIGISDDIQSDIDKTHQIVFDGLADFVQNGLSSNQTEDGGTFQKIEAYRIEISYEMQYTRQSYSNNAATNGYGQNQQQEVIAPETESVDSVA